MPLTENQTFSIAASIPRSAGAVIGEWETNGTLQGASGVSDSTTALYLRLERISCPSCSLIQNCPFAGPETETICSRFTITERWTRANAP